MKPRFVVIGNINFDQTYLVDSMPSAHTKVRALDGWISPGGAAANTAYWLARADAHVVMLGCVGDDLLGKYALQSLQGVGVDTSYVQIDIGGTTGMASVFLSPHDKRMVTWGGSNRSFRFDLLDGQILSSNTHLHVATQLTAEVEPLALLAKSNGSTLSIEWNGYDYRHLRPPIDVSFMNQDELSRLTHGKKEPLECAHEIAKTRNGLVVVTRGAEGAMAVDSVNASYMPVKEIEVMDRTGAGDAFDAGFLLAWTERKSPEECLTRALQQAETVLQMKGARPS